MTTPLGRREFFALEAGEYLERLSMLAGGANPPPAEELVRHARALRGAALMAGPPGFAVAAAAIETVAKSVRDGSLAWTPALGDRVADALEDCKALLRNVREWADSDAQRCERIADQLESGEGGIRRRPSAGGADGSSLTAGVRAYVAREAAAVAAVLDQVADAVERRPAPNSADPLVQRLQPLRGLGSLPGLSPLPELLETLDQSVALASRSAAWSPRAGAAFRAVGSALARMARDIAELGIPQHDSAEVIKATDAIREAFLTEEDVVEIAALFAHLDPAPVVSRGLAPVPRPVGDETVELVSLADRIRQAADQSRGHVHRTVRTLQLSSLVLTLRGVSLSTPVRTGAAEYFARVEREALSGRALARADEFSASLRRAADILAEAAGSTGGAELAARLAPLAGELDAIAGIEAVPPLTIIPIEALAPVDEGPVVPIESLLLRTEPGFTADYLPFERTFSTWFRLQTEGADGPIVAIESLAPDEEAELVPIQSLLYRGRRALERADRVRIELDAALRVKLDPRGIETLLGELLDLVPLALADER